jgi:hypothetical protein
LIGINHIICDSDGNGFGIDFRTIIINSGSIFVYTNTNPLFKSAPTVVDSPNITIFYGIVTAPDLSDISGRCLGIGNLSLPILSQWHLQFQDRFNESSFHILVDATRTQSLWVSISSGDNFTISAMSGSYFGRVELSDHGSMFSVGSGLAFYPEARVVLDVDSEIGDPPLSLIHTCELGQGSIVIANDWIVECDGRIGMVAFESPLLITGTTATNVIIVYFFPETETQISARPWVRVWFPGSR